jgi:hypothetical protein
MAIAKAHPPNGSTLWLVVGPGLEHHPRQPTEPTGRWPMDRTARDDRPYRPGAGRGQLSMTAHGVASP